MYEACTSRFPEMDAAILCAAVADFRVESVADEKIKRGKDDFTLSLVPNPDIAATLGSMKRADQRLVGFALETDHEEEHAVSKLNKKNLDFIVLNSMRNEGTCFQSDDNQISIINRDGVYHYDKKSKSEVACDIVCALSKTIENQPLQ